MGGKILILGGGFGGIRTALNLERFLGGHVEITLIDQNSYHLFVPALYEVASAYGSNHDPFAMALRKSIAIPFSQIFEGKKINFVQASVRHIDLRGQIVTTASDHAFSYDYLVLALGSQTADFGIPGVYEYACQFKTIEDGLMVNQKIKTLFHQAASAGHTLPLKVFICGAGFTGIELAGELALLARKISRHLKLPSRALHIYMFEAASTILPLISDRERAMIRNRLTRLGVIVMENATIESVGDGEVKLKNGQMMKGDLVIWTAGIQANKLLQSVEGLELTPRGKIITGEHLHLSNYKNMFAVGDNIEFIDHKTQKPIPALAYLAVDHGNIVAQNIQRSINGNELKIHKPFYDLWIAPVGGTWAVAHLWWGICVSGFLGWVVRELSDLRYFLSILPFGKALKLFFYDLRIFSKNN